MKSILALVLLSLGSISFAAMGPVPATSPVPAADACCCTDCSCDDCGCKDGCCTGGGCCESCGDCCEDDCCGNGCC